MIKKAVRVLQGGGIIVFPTSSIYGLGADAENEFAVRRIFHIKHRQPAKPILLLVRDTTQATHWVREFPRTAKVLATRFWPGELTLVLPASRKASPILTGGSGKIGIRVPRHPAARALVEAFGGPVTGTSANISGRSGCRAVNHLDSEIADNADLIIDAGRLHQTAPSTVVDVSGNKVRIIREGAVSGDKVIAAVSGSKDIDKETLHSI